MLHPAVQINYASRRQCDCIMYIFTLGHIFRPKSYIIDKPNCSYLIICFNVALIYSLGLYILQLHEQFTYQYIFALS